MEIIKYFPKPYPDELLYSVIARYQKHIGSVRGELLKSLWGNVFSYSTSYQVTRLQKLLDNTLLGEIYSAKEVAFQHTLLPFYSAFSGREFQCQLFKRMLDGTLNAFYGHAGGHVRKIAEKDDLQYCPECVKVDTKLYGEPYWHRIHQVPGVMICPVHEIQLQNLCPVCSAPILPRGIEYACLSDRCVNGHELSKVIDNGFSGKTLRHLIGYAREAYKLLNADYCYEPESISKRYVTRLRNLGVMGLRGQLFKASDFSNSFIEHYGTEFLELLDSSVEINRPHNWLREMVWQYGYKHLRHPLRHLLIIKYLFGSISNFILADTEYLPFGKGPWPCLNPAATHYKMAVIKNSYFYHGKQKKIYGQFTCECGYKYSRVGPDKNKEDQYRADNVITYGQTWEDKLRELVDSKKFTMKEVGKKLKVDESTVITHNNNYKRKNNQKITSRTKKELYLKNYRSKIEEVINATPNITRRKIVGVAAKEYKWLKNHDKEWLMNILPKSKQIIQPYLETYRKNLLQVLKQNPDIKRTEVIKLASREYYWLKLNDREWLMNTLPKARVFVNRIDWNLRDQNYVSSIKSVVREILKEEGKPKRITGTIICEKIPGLRFHLNNSTYSVLLCETKEILSQYPESRDKYMIRCVNWAVSKLIISGEILTENRIKQLLNCKQLSNPIKKYIETIINSP